MNQEIVTKAIDMVNKGYNLNQVAAMLMVDRVSLMDAINGASGVSSGPTPKKVKKVETQIEPMFEDEEGL